MVTRSFVEIGCFKITFYLDYRQPTPMVKVEKDNKVVARVYSRYLIGALTIASTMEAIYPHIGYKVLNTLSKFRIILGSPSYSQNNTESLLLAFPEAKAPSNDGCSVSLPLPLTAFRKKS